MEVAARTKYNKVCRQHFTKEFMILHTWYGILVLGNVIIFLPQAQYCPMRIILAG